MANNHFPLRVNAGFLNNQPIGYSREIHFDLPEVKLGTDMQVQNCNGLARLSRTTNGILVQAKFSAGQHAECVRCLIEFEQSLETEFSELFAFNSRSISESGLILPDDGNIDLAPLLREYLLLEIPISSLCRPDCKGLCVECGEDLNETTCEHQAQQAGG